MWISLVADSLEMIEMSSRYPFKIRALFFEIYTHVSDRKFCNSIGSLVLANPVAVISIHGRAKLDAVFSMMTKTFSFVHELPILLRISDSVEMCICFAAYSSILRLYNAV